MSPLEILEFEHFPFGSFGFDPRFEQLSATAVVNNIVQCYRAKMHQNANGHFEGPIDFFDQSF